MFKKNKFYQITIGFAFVASMASCDLEEEIYTEILSSEFGQTEEEVTGLVGAAYASYGGWIGNTWVNDVISSDIGIVPARGTDWAENGQWARLHTHEFHPEDFYANGSWNTLYTGVNNTNRIIFQLEEIGTDAALQTVKELRVLRAINYYHLMDQYGNVPLVTSFADADESPSNNSRSEIFNFVVSEVEAVINDLPTDVNATYGKINKWTAHALLAKTYLNAEVFNGTAQWEKVIEHTNAIIDSGNYLLTPNFFDNFKPKISFNPSLSSDSIWIVNGRFSFSHISKSTPNQMLIFSGMLFFLLLFDKTCPYASESCLSQFLSILLSNFS